MIAFLSLFFCLFTIGHSKNAIFTFNRDFDVSEQHSFHHFERSDSIGGYKPTWESLDSRPLPTWYDRAKIGIFIHWGVFSVPSFGSEWFWKSWKSESTTTAYRDFMKQRYPPDFTYQDFAKEFTAEFYNATEWSKIFADSGARYVVLTSKHHEGYTLWPSKYSFSWNSADVGPHKDLIGELAEAIRKNTHMKFGLYHSLFEWYNPLWLADQRNNFTTDNFVTSKTMPELRELIHLYKPEVIWSDGEWDAPDTYWKSKEFLAWLYNESPVKDTIVVNDRWGHETACHHGDFYTCSDRYNPGVLQKHKWENAMTLDKKSWGYRRNAAISDFLTIEELIKELVSTVSCGGNLLINVGPTKDGIIAPIFQERLRDLGNWLRTNGEAIYNSEPYDIQRDTVNDEVWWTQNTERKHIYMSILRWPEDNVLFVQPIKLGDQYRLCLLGVKCGLTYKNTKKALQIYLPAEANRGQAAWVVRIDLSPST